MKLFYTMICDICFVTPACASGIAFRSLCRGSLICRIPWLPLFLALLTGMVSTAHATIGGTVLKEVRDSKVGIQMPTVPTGSAVDASGNIYVTGYQKLISGTSGEDYYTIKIGADFKVDTLWGTKSHNEDNNDDRATAITVDSAGNVIVTGNVTLSDGSKRIHTIKYSGSTGEILWEHTFLPSGPAHTSDTAASLAAYGGYVYITGVARVSGSTSDDILILKYDNSYSDGGSHAPVTAVVYDRSGTQDVADSISVAAGGVAVVGRTWNGAEFDMLTLKYDLDLTEATRQAWPHSSPGGNSPGNNGSWGRFVKVDPDGNVIASGFDISSSSDKDIYTAKYCDNPDSLKCNGAAQGARIWERRYQGGFADDVKDLVVDANKDVYITGITSPMSSSTDFYTAKYNGATGVLVWEAKTDGGSIIDVANAMVVDDSGEVYVTGYAKLNGVDTIQTMKYKKDATSGRLLWQRTYKNPDNPPGNPEMLDIRGTGIGLLSDGVAVVGWASKLSTPAVESGTATTGTANTLQDVAKSWAPNQYGNYYLKITETNPPGGANKDQVRPITSSTGQAQTPKDTLTVSPGFPAVVNAGDSYEIVSIDTDYYAVKYEKGTLDRPTDLTVSTTSNSALHLTWSDNATSETGFKLERCKGKGCDFSVLDATITLGANVNTYDDNDANNTTNGTPRLDPDTYYYYRIKAYTLTPEESDYSNSVRGLTVSLSYPMPLAGNIFTYDGTDHQEDTSPAVAVGPDNNPVVTGRSYLSGDGFDYYTIKLDRTKMDLPAGILWAARYDAGQYDNDEATCLAVDKDNKVIVSGDSVLPPVGGGANMNVLMTVKYQNPPAVDGFNNPIHSWSDKYNGPGKIDDHATAVATDAAGNFVVVGHGKKDSGNHQYIYAVKYNADNSRAWAGELYDAGENGKPVAVLFGADGNIFVTGQRNEGTALSPAFNYITLKYCGNSDPAKCNNKTPGQIIWADVYDSGRGNDQAASMALDAGNNVYVTGSAINSAGNQDFYTIKYDGTAVTPVQMIWPGGALSVDGSESGEAVAVRVDPLNGDLLVAGTVLSDPGNHDFGLFRFKADGTLRWKKILLRPDNDDYVVGMALDASGNAFVAGNTSRGSGTASMAAQFDSAGTVIQSNIYNASAAQEDRTTNIAVNTLNEAFVVGTTRSSSIDYLLYKIPTWPVQAPAPVTVTPGYTTLAFSWPATSTASAGVISYKGKRADGACSENSDFGAEFAIPSNSYNASGLPQNTIYCYAFKTTTTLSGDSRWIAVTVTTADPSAPTLTVTPANTTQIDLSWTAATTGQDGFQVWRCADSAATACTDFGGSPLATTGGAATGYSDQTVCPGMVYRYKVRAIGSGWTSAFSTTLGAIPPAVDNIFVDPGFEAPNPMAAGQALGWTYAATYIQSNVASEVRFDAGVQHSGAQSLNLNGLTTTAYEGIKQYVRFTPGGKYELSAWFKTAAPAGKIACDSLDGSNFSIANSGTTSDWEQRTQVLAIPSPSASSRVRCYVYQGYQGSIDDIQIKPLYDLIATPYSESQINLAWIDSAHDETGYEIWRCKDPDQTTACTDFALIDKVAANMTAYGSSGLEPNAKYRFQVRPYKTVPSSCGGGWYGAFSNIAGPAQALYTKPVLSKTIPNTTQVNLSWGDTTSGESSFLMQRCMGQNCTFDAGHSLVETQLPPGLDKDSTQNWQDTGVCVSTDYQYRVKPVNNGIQSASGCWNKSTPLNISNFKANFLTRVKIPGNAAGYTGMKDDFSDIRFYDETAKKELPYWIEDKSDKNWAIVWFKTGPSNNINLYYDNGAATSASNLTSIFGSGVMAFFPFSEGATINGTSYDKSGLGNNLGLYYTAGYGIVDPGVSRLGPDSGNVISASGERWRNARGGAVNLPTGSIATIEAWIYPKSPQANSYNSIASFGQDYATQRLYLSLQDNGRPAMYGFNNDFVPGTGPQATFNAWNHIAVVVNGTAVTLYMNGQPVPGTLASTPTLLSMQLYVGSDRDGIAFNGFIDDVRIYNRALGAPDIAMRYAPTLPSVSVGDASGSASCLTFSGGWGDDTFYSTTLPVAMAAPVPPTTLNAVANNEAKVTLTWTNKTSDQTGFKIFRCIGNGCSFAATPDYTVQNTAAINTTVTYADTTGLVPGTIYRYKVQAYKTGVSCPWDSAADTAPTNNTLTMPLPVPTGLAKAYSFSATCNDLRFADSDGSTILNHWLESGCNTSATKAWLKFASLPAGPKTIYQYYGNPDATAPVAPDLGTFFDFYDDFAGQTLNSSKWTKVENGGSFITQNNGLLVSGGNGYWNTTGIYSNANFARPFVLEFSHFRTGGNYAMFGAKNTAANTNYTGLVYGIYPVYDGNGNRLIVYQDNVSSADNLKPIASDAWQYYKIEVPATGANYYHGSAPVPSAYYPSGYTQFYTTTNSSVTPLKLGMDVHNQAFTLGNVKLRKYANPEPSLTQVSEQSGAFLSGGAWKFQRQLSINNNTGSALANYQLPVFVDTTPLAADQIRISWVNNTVSETGSIIERCDNTANNNACATTFAVEKTFNVTGNGITSYIDREVKRNNAYCYRVSASRTTTPAWTTPATTPICEPAHQQAAPVLSAVGTTTQIKLDWTEADFASDSGTATSGSTTTLTHSTKSWGTNQWSGYYLKMTAGAAGNIDVSRRIASNTNNAITVESAFPAAIANTHTYQIIPADGYGNMVSGIAGEYGYEIERCSGAGCTPVPADKIATLAPNAARTYIDPLCSGSYNYRIHVVKYGPNGTLLTAADSWPDYSNTVSADIISAPAPTKVKATRVSEAQITLTWQDNTGDETGFNIYRCKDAGGVACTNFALLATVPAATGTASGAPSGTGTTVTYTDMKDLAQDSTYRYQVKAIGTGTTCPAWESLAGTPDPAYVSGDARATTTNSAPSSLNVLAGNTTQVNVSWNDNTASEGAIILERCTGAGCSDFSYLSNISSIAAPAKQNKVFYPFASDLKDTSGSGLDLGRTPVLNTSTNAYFNDGLYLYGSWNDSFQSPVTGILDTDTHAIEFDFKIRQYMGSMGKVFGYTVATATPDKSSPGIYVPVSGSGYGLSWVYLDGSGGSSEIHIGVNGIGDASGAFTTNQWYHLRGEKLGNKFTVYVDGALKGSTSVVSPQQTGNFSLTFGKDAATTSPAQINLKNFSIDGNVQFADTSECAGTTYSYRARAVRDGFASAHVTIANYIKNFPTKVVIPASIVAGRTVAQINDLRFYDSALKSDLPYWIEGVQTDGTAVVWIKTGNNDNPAITLYSNKNATTAVSASDGTKVFDFFDDFNGTSLGSAWTKSATGAATLVVGGGAVTLDNPGYGKASITQNFSTATLYVLETRVKVGSAYPNNNRIRGFARSAPGDSGFFSDASPVQVFFGSYTGKTIPTDLFIRSRLTHSDTTANTWDVFKEDGTSIFSGTYAATPTATIAYTVGDSNAAIQNGTITLDWVLARPYVATEPLGTVDTAVAFPSLSPGMGGSGGWTVSTPVQIASFQPNYQTRLTVAKAANMKSDFSDIRFYDTTAQTELPYWIESKTDGVSASVWVKTGATNTVAMYYGNPGATSTAVGASVMFDLFDDFTSLDTAIWDKSDALADITVDGSGTGTVRLNSGALVSKSPIVSNPKNYAFEMKTYLPGPTDVWFTGLVLANDRLLKPSNGNGNALARANFSTVNTLQGVAADGTSASNNLSSPNFDSSTNYIGASNAKIVGIGFPGGNPIRFFSRNPDTYTDMVPQAASDGTWNPTNTTTSAYLFLGHVFGMDGLAINTTDMVVDWVRVRKYAYPEPQASVNTGQFPGNLANSGAGSWTAGLLLNINNFQPNFPTMMTVNWKSGMKADFSDIRFYDTTAKVELPYWMERYTASSEATVWLKTGVNNTIAMYYGNTLATNAGNGVKVFEFFDDFTAATLDTGVWSKSDPSATITVDGTGTGKLRINTGAVYSNSPLVSSPQNLVYEMKNQWAGPLAGAPGLTVSNYQYFLGGNAGSSMYAVNRLESTGSLRAQAGDGAVAGNNVAAEYYPNSSGTTLAPLNTDGITGIEFQGDTGKISYFRKNPDTYADLARVTKPAVVAIKDSSKNRATNGWTYGGGYYVKITSGLNNGLTSALASYTNNAITVNPPFPYFFSIGDTYEVRLNGYNDLAESGSMTGTWNAPSYLFMGSNVGSGQGTSGGPTADISDLTIDWVRIRKYVNPMPVVTVGAVSVNQAPAPDIYQFLNNWSGPYSPVITVTTPGVANLTLNPDFESGSDKWTLNGATEETSTSASGLKSVKLSSTMAKGSGGANIYQSLPKLLPGGTYTLSGNIKANLVNGYVYCRLMVNGTWANPSASGYQEYQLPYSDSARNNQQWQSFSYPITLSSAIDGANLSVVCGLYRGNDTAPDGVDTAYIDMLQVVPGNQSAFNLAATKVSESRIDLAWTDMSADETGYKILRCADSASPPCSDFTFLASVAAGVTSYKDTQTLQPNMTYRYKVSAYKTAPGSCNGGWESVYSNIAFAKTDDASPVSLTATMIDTTQVDLSWTDKSLGESGFAIERSTDGTTFNPLPPYPTPPYPTLAAINSSAFSDQTACPATTYTYRVRSLNRGLSMDGGLASNCVTPGDSWNKRKHLIISNFQPQFQTALYVAFVTGMKADFSDLRFFDATSGKELPLWIESKRDGVSAKFWIKTGDNNNIDMYYGNTNAASTGNAANIFDFWDDFAGGVINTAKWTVVNASGLSVSGGYMHGTNTSGQIKSVATFPAGSVLEYKAKAIKWPDNPWYIGGFAPPSYYIGWAPYYDWWITNNTWPSGDGRGMYITYVPGYLEKLGDGFNYNTTDFPSKNEVMSSDNMLYRVTAKDAGNVAFHVDNLDRLDGQGKSVVLADIGNVASAYSGAPIVIGGSVVNPGQTLTADWGSFGGISGGGALQVDWDWVRVRKYAATEPVVTLDFEVASSSLTPSQTCFSFANQWGDGATMYYSNISNSVTTPAALPPSNLAATEVIPNRVNLTWLDNSNDETGFEIQDCCTDCTPASCVNVTVPANTSAYSATGLAFGSTHCYSVRAVKSGAICGWPTPWSSSNCVNLSDTIHLDAVALNPFAVKLDWNNIPNDGRGFEIEKKLASGEFATIAAVGNLFTYTDKVGVVPLKSYTYRVRKVSNKVLSDNFSAGFDSLLWAAEAGQSWRVPDPAAVMNNDVLVSDTGNGLASLSAANGKLEFYSKSKGGAGVVYEGVQLKDLSLTRSDFDVQLDYAITKVVNSSTQNANVYVNLRYDTSAPAGYPYKIQLYRARIKDTDNIMKDAYVAQYTEVTPNKTYQYIFPTSDLSGRLRIAKTTGSDGNASVSLYTSSGGRWVLLKEIALGSAQVVPTWLTVLQQLAGNEAANTDMRVAISNIALFESVNANPYSNEAQVTYTYPPERGGATINTTPAFTAADGVCLP